VRDWHIEAPACASDRAVTSADYRDTVAAIDNAFDGYMIF
jgi:hypothetical protein